MYHTIKIEGVDQQTHRFLWRDMEDRTPDVYAMTSVSFGDRPAAAIAAVALKKTAESAQDEYPVASQAITRNTYVDDVLGSCADTKEAEILTKQIDGILETGGFKIKEWGISGQKQENDKGKFKSIAIFYGLGFLVILGMIPWNQWFS